jgi:hypothetical protein
LFCHVTTRIDGRPDDDLLSQKGFSGFPSLAIMDAEGEILKKDVGRSVAAMGSAVDAVQAYSLLKTKAAAGEKGLDAKLFVAEVKLGKIDVSEAKKQLGKFKLSGDDKKLLDGLIFDKELAGWFSEARSGSTTPADFFKKIYGAYKAGSRPSDDEQSQFTFWNFLLQGAETAGDAEAFEVAADKAVERTRKGFEKRLKAIRRKAKK